MTTTYISVAEYAALHNRTPGTVRQLIRTGSLPATKVGRAWIIDADTPYPDDRRAGNGRQPAKITIPDGWKP